MSIEGIHDSLNEDLFVELKNEYLKEGLNVKILNSLQQYAPDNFLITWLRRNNFNCCMVATIRVLGRVSRKSRKRFSPEMPIAQT